MIVIPMIYLFLVSLFLYFAIYILSIQNTNLTNRKFLYFCISNSICSLLWFCIFGYNFESYNISFLLVNIFFNIISLYLMNSLVLEFINSNTKLTKIGFVITNLTVGLLTILELSPILSLKVSVMELISFKISFKTYILIFVLNVFCFIIGVISLVRGNKANNYGIRQKNQFRYILIFYVILNTIQTTILLISNARLFYIYQSYLISFLIFSTVYFIVVIVLRPVDIVEIIVSEEILSKIQDLILLMDLQGKITSINNRVEELLGYKKQMIIGKSIYNVVFDDKKVKEEITKIQDCSKECEKYSGSSIEVSFKTFENKIIPIRVGLSVLKDEEEQLLGIAMVGQDLRETKHLRQEIVERMLIEDQFKRANQRLKELDKLKTDFLSTISHELRTPLTSILGFSKIVNKKLDDIVFDYMKNNDKKLVKAFTQVKENIDIIILEGERLTSLITDVLDIKKMESGKLDFKMQEVSIIDIIERAIIATSSLLNQKNLEIIKEFENNLPKIIGDTDRLIQVCINLLSNAIKFSEIGDKIICKVIMKENDIITSIIDEGIGISQSDIYKIFEKFKQVGDTIPEKNRGTGLGLSICKQIIEHHNGKIWVESKVGIGSKFSFSIHKYQK